MFICEIWLFNWYFPQFCISDMSKYGYLEVFQRARSTSRCDPNLIAGLLLLPYLFGYKTGVSSL